MSARCLTITDIVSANMSESTSCAPRSSSARAQSIDSAIEGGFFRSSSLIIPITSTRRRATVCSSSGACRRTISSSCSSAGRSSQQELLAEDVVLHGIPASARRLRLDAKQLLAVVPLVQGLRLVEALVALQAHELATEVRGQRLCQLRLAHARRTLDENGLAELGREERDERGGLRGVGYLPGEPTARVARAAPSAVASPGGWPARPRASR